MKIKITLLSLLFILFSNTSYAKKSELTLDNLKPTGLVASSLTETSLVVSWNNIKGGNVKSYEIFKDGKKIGERYPSYHYYYSSSYLYVTGLTPGTTYTFTVKAVYSNGGSSEFSDELIVTTKGGSTVDRTAPTAPGDLALITRNNNSLSFKFGPSVDNESISYYEIFANDKKVGTLNQSNATVTYGRISYTVNNLMEATSYDIKIRAVDTAGNISNFSNVLTVSTDGGNEQAPTKPTNLSSNNQTNSSISIQWAESTSNNRILGYKVYQNGVKIAHTNAYNRSYQIDNLEANTEYTFTIKAYDYRQNESDFSEPLKVSTKAVEVTNNPEPESQTELNIYPNPAVNVLNVEVPNAGWSTYYYVYNLSGRIVKYGKLYNGKIYVNNLRSGTYSLIISSGYKKYKKQFVKQ